VADPVKDLVRRFQALEAELDQLIRSVEAGGRRADMIRRAAALAETVEDLRPHVGKWSRAIVGGQFRESAGAANTTLWRAGLLARTRLRPFEVRAALALVTRVHRHLDATLSGLMRGLVLSDPRKAVAAVEKALATDGLLVRIADGTTRVLTPGGRYWQPSSYAEMVSRTGIADARRTAFKTRYLANGVDVVQVVENGSVHEECIRWEGEYLSLTGAAKELPTVEDAEAQGLFHPNCSHRYVVAVDYDQPELPEEAAEAAGEELPARSVLALSPRDPRTPPPTIPRAVIPGPSFRR
jgi:hypothetical protein